MKKILLFALTFLAGVTCISCGKEGSHTIQTADSQVLGKHKEFFSVTDEGATWTFSEEGSVIPEQKFIIKVPLKLEKPLDLGEHGGLRLGAMNVEIIGEDGDPIANHSFDLGLTPLDTSVHDELKDFLKSKEGTVWVAPFNLTLGNPDLASELEKKFEKATGLRIVDVEFVNVDINSSDSASSSSDDTNGSEDMSDESASASTGNLGVENVILPSQLKGKVEVIKADKEVSSLGFPEVTLTFKLLQTVNTASLLSPYGQMWIVGAGQTASGVDVKSLMPSYKEWRTNDSDGNEFKSFLESDPGETITLTFSGSKEGGDVDAGLQELEKFKLKLTK